jgi:hypothetical protein
MEQNNPRFPQQDQPDKIHGDEDAMKEKYIRDSGKIEDLPEQTPQMNTNVKKSDKEESSHLTDRSGEERKEDYINTDERKRDLDRRGL